ncbi:MAG TPA: hypothetical protein VKB41_10790 [Steroidobacteraceae bacterium]|nr:hypothetical protein [Steroidobacteraceae bacterium]
MSSTHTRNHFNSDPRHWQAGPILSAGVLEPLHELNRAWLALLATMPRHWTAQAGSRLPDPVCAGLLTLSGEQRADVARCPFSLFSARFNDGLYWLGVTASGEVHDFEFTDEFAREIGEFGQLALFFAWHLVRANPASARIVLGMSDQTISVFASLSLATVQRLGHCPGLFSARWPDRNWFWLRLLASATQSETAEVRTLGLQMLAAELTASARRDAPAL